MFKFKIFAVSLFISLFSYSQSYRTQPLSDEVRTVEVNKNGNWNSYPIIAKNSDEFVNIGLDRISEESLGRLRYRMLHCGANWKVSADISEIDYLDGFNDNYIRDYYRSVNTTVGYTHYDLKIPNEDVRPKLSGNYVVEVYEDGAPENVLLTACFSVLDSQVGVGGSVSSRTNIDVNRGHQQLSLAINHTYNLRDPLTEMKVYVSQNNRLDTERLLKKPSFIGGNKLVYEHVRDLIFEAGNEYRRFETASYRYNGMNIQGIEYKRPHYLMHILPDRVRAGHSYSYDQDQNGRFINANKENMDRPESIDYFMTTFTLKADEPLLERVFVNGNFTNNSFTDRYMMHYDDDKREYRLSLLLKQGLYNYIYLTQNSSMGFTTSKLEGNYYETENEYNVMVYYRPQGQRYDALVGVATINSRSR